MAPLSPRGRARLTDGATGALIPPTEGNTASAIRVETKRFTSRHHCSSSDTRRAPLQWNVSGGRETFAQNLRP